MYDNTSDAKLEQTVTNLRGIVTCECCLSVLMSAIRRWVVMINLEDQLESTLQDKETGDRQDEVDCECFCEAQSDGKAS